MLPIAIFLVVLAFFSLNAILHPHRVLALALCMYAFEVLLQSMSSLFVASGFLVNVSVAACVGLAFAFYLWHVKLKPTIPMVFWLTMALYGYAYSTLFWRSDFYNTWHGQLWFDNVPQLLVILFCGSLLVDSNKSLRDVFLVTLVFGALVTIGLHVFCEWEGRGITLPGIAENDQSPVLSLAQVGGYVAIVAALISIDRLPGWKLFKWFVVAMGLYLAFRTESRGQVAGAIIVILFYTPISWGVVSVKSVVSGVIATVALVLSILLILPFVDLDRFQDSEVLSGVSDRVTFMQEVGHAYLDGSAMDHIFGMGASASYSIADSYVHNIPFEVLCEEGCVGLLLLTILLFIPAKKAFAMVIKSSLSSQPNIANSLAGNTLVIALALMTFEFILSNKQSSLYGAQNLFLFAILLDRSADELIAVSNAKRQEY